MKRGLLGGLISLPDGTYTVHAWAQQGGTALQGRAEVLAGGSATVDLRPQGN